MASALRRLANRVERLFRPPPPPPAELSQDDIDRREAARSNILDFTTYTKPDYFVGWHHRLMARYIDDLVEGRIRRLMIFCPPRAGKCLASGTPVFMADGTEKPIEEVRTSDMVMSLSPRYDVVASKVIAVAANGVRPVKTIVLQSGRRVTATDNHPFMTVSGWRDAGDLKVGDSVACLRQLPLPDNPTPLPTGFAALLGYLVGDGSFGKGDAIITTKEPATVAHLEEIGAAHGWVLHRTRLSYHLRIVTEVVEVPPPGDIRGEHNPGAKLTRASIADARSRVAAGESQGSIARSLGVSRRAVGMALSGRTWSESAVGTVRGERQHGAVLTEDRVRAIWADLQSGDRVGVVAKRHGVTQQHVSLIKSGKLWRHVTGITSRVRRSLGVAPAKHALAPYMAPAKAHGKAVPPCIFAAGHDDVCAFLAAYFNSDGTVSSSNRAPVASFGSVSRELLEGVQRLLFRLGIYSRLRRKRGRYKGEVHLSWMLSLDGADIELFAAQVPARGERGRKLREAAAKASASRHFPEYDAIPPGWKAHLTHKGWWHKKYFGVNFDKTYTHGTARHIVRAAADNEDNERLRGLCNPAIIWERIVAIEDAGEQPTYDLEVADTHSFFANGVAVHNSQLTSISLPAYFLGRFPDARVLACSNVAKLAQGWNRKVKRVITAAPYKALFPGTQVYGKNVRTAAQGQWLNNMDEFEIVDHVGGYRAAGVGMAIAGLGMDLGIIDDPIKTAAEARSETLRDAQWEWFTQDFLTRQMPGARVLVTLTRWTWDDIVGRHLRLLEEGAAGEPWTVLRLPAIAEKEQAHPEDPRQPGEALWPEWYPLSFLHPMRDANPFAFEALYQQNPTPREGSLFHEASFRILDAAPSRDQFQRIIRWWDKGYAAEGDFTAGALVGLTHDRRIIVLDMVRVRLAPRKRNQVILDTAHLDREQWGHVKTLVEQPPGAGTETTDLLIRALVGFPVEARCPRGAKEERAEALSDQCDAENVWLVRGPWNRPLIKESLTFPGGENDDQIDSLTGIVQEFGLYTPSATVAVALDAAPTPAPATIPTPTPRGPERDAYDDDGPRRPRMFGK